MRVEANPPGRERGLALTSSATSFDLEPVRSLPAIVEDEPARGRRVQQVAKAKRGLAATALAYDERDAGGVGIVRH